MGFLDRILKRTPEPVDPTITPNYAIRAGQLVQLQGALGVLVDTLKQTGCQSAPGWPERIAEYVEEIKLAGDLRGRQFGWDEFVDLLFEIRPAIKGTPDAGWEAVVDAQQQLMRLVEGMREPRSDELS